MAVKTKKRATKPKAPVSKPTKAVAAQDDVTPEVATTAAPNDQLRRADLINMVVERTGLKKKDVKPAVEAALHIMGEALAKEDAMALPPFGRVKIARKRELENADVYVCRIRRAKG